MELNTAGYMVVLVFAAVLAVGLLGGGVTGNVPAQSIPVNSGTVLSVGAAVLAIGVLIVAGLKQR